MDEKNPGKFSEYFRTMNSFTYILESVKSKLTKYSDFCRIASPEDTKIWACKNESQVGAKCT